MAEGFRSFRLAAKTRESAVVTSFFFTPTDDSPLWPARPGQYLTLKIPAPGAAKGYVLRNYSLSNAADATDGYRISVKRETGLSGAPDGIGSCWLHDQLEVGAQIEIAAPRGAFFLDESSGRPVVLLAGGIGLTPLLSMAYRLAEGDRKFWLFHAVENGDVQALHAETKALQKAHPDQMALCNVMRAPGAPDRAEARFDAEGVITADLLRAWLPLDDYQFYLCGPTPFMVAAWQILISLGVAADRIAYEFFGAGGSLAALAAKAAEPAPVKRERIPSQAPKSLERLDYLHDPDAFSLPETTAAVSAKPGPSAAEAAAEVTFARAGVTLAWSDAFGSILEMAEAAGLDPAFVCRAGVCNSCLCTVKEGAVDYTADPVEMPDPGQALICCSRPLGRVVLDL